MIKNYFKIAFRNIFQNKIYSSINIIGLSIGIASCILILLYVQNEFSYDKFNKNYENIYWIGTNSTWYGKTLISPVTPAPLGQELKDNFRDVISYNRVYYLGSMKQIFKYNSNKSFYEDGLIYADSNFFNFFSFHLLKGNKDHILSAPFTLVITKSIAEKYFGDEDPIGKVIQLERWNGKSFNFTVTGVASDPPSNSTLQFQFIASFSSLYTKEFNYTGIDGWNQMSFFTYVMLSGKSSAQSLEAKFPAFLNQRPESKEISEARNLSFFLKPIEDIHLFSHFDFFIETDIDVESLYILSVIAVFLLLIAIINFVNLSTARYTKRTKEVGVRKVMGALRIQLIRQFIAESILMSIIASIIAVILVELTIPFTKNLMGVELNFYLINKTATPFVIISAAILIGVLAGIYPALFLTSFKLDSILRNKFKLTKSGGITRKGMVAFQFTISIALIVCTILVQRQIRYMQNTNLGFNKNNLVLIPLINTDAAARANVFCTEVLKNPDVLMTSVASSFPGEINMKSAYRINGPESKNIPMWKIYIDPEYLKILDLKIKEGKIHESIKNNGEVIINEAAQAEFGLENAVGKELLRGNERLRIAAVIKDYNFQSLRDKISPLVLRITPTTSGVILCKVRGINYTSTVSYLKKKWSEVNKDIPFEYSFLDNDLNKLYIKESKFGNIVNIFSGLAIIVACLGLLGLSMFSIEQRIREIGIRKVLGASVPGIIKLVTKEFIMIVLLSNIIAWPVAYYFMKNWLSNYAFHINMNWWVFIVAGGVALLIAIATVGVQAIKAAIANPVKNLRYE